MNPTGPTPAQSVTREALSNQHRGHPSPQYSAVPANLMQQGNPNTAPRREVLNKGKADELKQGINTPTVIAPLPTPTVFNKPIAPPTHQHQPAFSSIPTPLPVIPTHTPMPSFTFTPTQQHAQFREFLNKNKAEELKHGINTPTIVAPLSTPQVYNRPLSPSDFEQPNSTFTSFPSHIPVQQPTTTFYTLPTQQTSHTGLGRTFLSNPTSSSISMISWLALAILPTVLFLVAVFNPLLFIPAAVIIVPSEFVLMIALLGRKNLCCCC